VVMGRPSSRIFEGLGNIIRKMSWHGVGSANSIFRPATNEIGKERFRKITPHILFPLDFQEIITFGGSGTVNKCFIKILYSICIYLRKSIL